MNFRGAFLLVLLPLLAACDHTTDMAEVEAMQTQMTPTVASYEAMSFTKLSYPASEPVSVTAETPVFDFGGDGRSHVVALEIPQRSDVITIDIRTDSAFPCRNCAMRTFFPKVVLLDADKKPLASPMLQGPFYTYGENGAYLFRHVWLDVAPAMRAHYAVIYTTRSLIAAGEEAVYGGPGVAMAGPLFIPIGGQRAAVKGSPTGKILIVLRTPGPPVTE